MLAVFKLCAAELILYGLADEWQSSLRSLPAPDAAIARELFWCWYHATGNGCGTNENHDPIL